MAYIETRPKSRFWHFSFVAEKKRCRGSTGVVARDKPSSKKLVNRREAQDRANIIQRYFKDRNADALLALGQKKLADKLLNANGGQKAVQTRSFKALFDDYLEHYKREHHPSDGYLNLVERYYLKHFLEQWKSIAEVTKDSVGEYKARREVKANTQHKELIVLRLFLRWCAEKGYLAEPPEFKVPSGRSTFKSRPPTRAEVEQILAQLPDITTPYGVTKQRQPVREFFQFMFFQGLRRGTVEKAEWSDVFVKDGRWYFRIRAEVDKSRFDRVVPLHKRSIDALQSLGVKQTGLIFGRHDYRAILAKVLKDLKLRHFRLHDFRHARVDELVQKTTDLSAIQYLAGHRDLKTTQMYLHPDVKRAENLFDNEQD